jgi:DNA polymerase-3 subunit epsilon
MKYILPFDSETSKMPEWTMRSHDPAQPHIVQLAAVLVEEVARVHVDQMDVIVRPDGWTIEPDTIEIHGITQEQAMDEGIPEDEALDMFMELYKRCDLRIAHGTNFDNRIIRIALMRYRPDLVSDEEWKNKALYFCTYQKGKKIMGGKAGHTLEECYLYFMKKEMEGRPHSAMPDTKACLDIYYEIQNHNRD